MWNRVLLISNISIESYWRINTNKHRYSANNEIQIEFVQYEDCQKSIERIQIADAIAVCLNFESLYPNLLIDAISDKNTYEDIIKDCGRRCEELYAFIKSNSYGLVIWFGFEDYYCVQNFIYGSLPAFEGTVDQLNKFLNNLLKEESFIDLKRLIATIGVNNSYDSKGKYRWDAPYSKELIQLMADELYKQYLIAKGITKKCLVLDCDNVLWGGVLSEDGIESIKLAGSGLGHIYQDFQRFILSLYYHGVILTVCSKNDSSDVLAMFREHSEMILKEEHIACFQVNWEDKPTNIRKIAEKLNIGLDSMVFVDDSPDEIRAVKAMLPEVTAILFERDMNYEQFSCFNLRSDVCLADIEKRNETYRTNVQREDMKDQSRSYDEYVKTLDIKTEIHRVIPIEYNRISELTQRTNKCTNGKRFTVSEIKECVETGTIELYSVHVSDRFSDLGLVGAIAIKNTELILFSLSCRALGREIESEMLKYIVSRWHLKKAFFHSTEKNEDIKKLLEEKIHPTFFE